ncbi:hypothetical protein [Ferrimicrobium sp.]|uniref:hypothetical protein n=1 Tax=Ferrimicrobium sp. TaxID=2926050 RepID=UPI0026119B1D|nr:hypothetical protein [Ferrimicrobium sp.]
MNPVGAIEARRVAQHRTRNVVYAVLWRYLIVAIVTLSSSNCTSPRDARWGRDLAGVI